MRGRHILLLLACACMPVIGCGGKSTSSPAPTPTPQSLSVGGSLSGLNQGAQLVVSNNGGDPMTLTANGSFSFNESTPYNGSYMVAVVHQPAGETCTIANYSGTGITSNISNVAVTCSANTFPVGGAISGLAPNSQVLLQDNGGDTLTVAANGSFTFATPLAYQGSYNVTVSTQPTGQTCTVSSGAGSSVIAPVTTVSVLCAANSFTIGGSTSGLDSAAQITLNNNGADPITLSADGTFVFPAPVAYNGAYNVTVATQPTGQTCTVANGSGLATATDITNIAVVCSADTYTVSGSISGLLGGGQLVLNNNGADPLTVTGNGNFTFATPVSFNGTFDVTVGTQPAGEVCTVSGGMGSQVTGNVSSVSVLCAVDTYTISGSVTGLSANGLVLKDNGGDTLLVPAGSTSFQFATPVAYNSGYNVTVFQNAYGETCTVSNGASTAVQANVTNVGVSCVLNTPTITGILPINGSAAGGTELTIFGTSFVAGSTSVTIGGVVIPASGVLVNSSGVLTVTTPAHATGNVAVSVTTGNGTSSAAPGGFTYVGPPTISCSATPASVSAGQTSTITSVATSPGGLPLTYSYSSTAGSITGSSATAVLSTNGVPPGTVTINCNAVDNLGQTGSASTTVSVF